MITVHKFPLLIDGENRIEVDGSSAVLHVGMQSMVTIWLCVDTEGQKRTRTFRIFGTGHEIPEGYLPCGSCFDGPFVWHVFERISPTAEEKHE